MAAAIYSFILSLDSDHAAFAGATEKVRKNDR